MSNPFKGAGIEGQLPVSMLGPDKAEKRRIAEETIAAALAPSYVIASTKDPEVISGLYSPLDQFATAYCRYRFREMDMAALKERFSQISLRNTLEKSGLSQNDIREGLIERAVQIVDKSIHKAYAFSERSYHLKTPYLKPLLDACDPYQLERVVEDVKKGADIELMRRYGLREDMKSEDAQALFDTLRLYAGNYIDYRFHKKEEAEIDRSHAQSIDRLAAHGIGEHVSSQFLRMAEEIVETHITHHIGRAM